MRYLSLFFLLSILFTKGVRAQDITPKTYLHYTGSSTIGNFISDASPVFGKVNFKMDTRPESVGGELAILEGRTDLTGIARPPSELTLGKGVVSTLIGWDAIAVIVHQSNKIQNLTQSQLKDIFTGKIKNWKELGGPDLIIAPYIVDVESATRKVFRSVILGKEDYVSCEVIRPDVDILANGRKTPVALAISVIHF